MKDFTPEIKDLIEYCTLMCVGKIGFTIEGFEEKLKYELGQAYQQGGVDTLESTTVFCP